MQARAGVVVRCVKGLGDGWHVLIVGLKPMASFVAGRSVDRARDTVTFERCDSSAHRCDFKALVSCQWQQLCGTGVMARVETVASVHGYNVPVWSQSSRQQAAHRT